MNLLIKSIAFVSILSLMACNGGDKNTDKTKTEYADASKDDANEIIEYHNIVLNLTDKNDRSLKSMDDNLETIAKGLKNPTDRFAFTGLMRLTDFGRVNFSKIKPETPPSALNRDDVNFFKGKIKLLNESYKSINDTYKTLTDYIKAEDFKDDKSVNGFKLLDSIYSQGKKYYAVNDEILNKLQVIGDDAERVILKTHPLKEFIYALKDDTQAAAALIALMGKHAKDYKKGESEIKKAYDALDAQNKKHIAMSFPSDSENSYKAKSFGDFNNSVTDFLASARKIMRQGAEKGSLTNENADELYQKKDMMRVYYNSFVD
ncbi:DUF3829 domain-containing protein [Pedobacter paludis]|uniref:DUF3829 domain-containing protein n=1 Tax=Pedobacter paludis TaxID=2203212 RepID=A0A317F1F6_9SPHI|nr:DUF3829 domain-containing protein [Pedobacter paludis]PWS31278.1 hypothetical protein DF947_11780 [Pedobacter paludis]